MLTRKDTADRETSDKRVVVDVSDQQLQRIVASHAVQGDRLNDLIEQRDQILDLRPQGTLFSDAVARNVEDGNSICSSCGLQVDKQVIDSSTTSSGREIVTVDLVDDERCGEV